MPAHAGIPGNERTDEPAKAGENLVQLHPPQSFSDGKTLLKPQTICADELARRKWKIKPQTLSVQMNLREESGNCGPEHGIISKAGQNFQIRTGYNKLKAYLH